MLTKNNPRFIPVPEGAIVPFHSDHGWYCLPGGPNTRVEGSTLISDTASVSDNAEVSGDAKVFGDASVSGNAEIFDNAEIFGDASVSGDAKVFGDASVSGNAVVYGDAEIFGDASVSGDAEVFGDASVLKGVLVGTAIYVQTYKWAIRLVGPGLVKVGCQTHPITEWLKEASAAIPWGSYCSEAEKKAIQKIIEGISLTENLGYTWAEKSN